jgi:predicted transcriptional regulator YheO
MAAETSQATVILRTLGQLVEPLASIMPGEGEVILHDLRALPNSIVAIGGALTGRGQGDPATDLLLRAHATGEYTTSIGYSSYLDDGREVCSSTIIFRDDADTPVAALCLNYDLRHWRVLKDLAAQMMPRTPPAPGGEEFPRDVDELASRLLRRAITAVDVPVPLMHKTHKVTVVRELKASGFFMLKESVERASHALGVTRFTIYNYLNELEGE